MQKQMLHHFDCCYSRDIEDLLYRLNSYFTADIAVQIFTKVGGRCPRPGLMAHSRKPMNIGLVQEKKILFDTFAHM